MKKSKSKKILFYGVLLILSLMLSLFACKPSREDNNLQNEPANTYLNNEELDNYEAWEKEKGNYIQIHEHLLRQADDKMEQLEAEIDDLSLEKQAKAREEAEKFEAQRTGFENKLNELKQANEQNWAELKKEVDQMADSLELSIQEIDKNVEFG